MNPNRPSLVVLLVVSAIVVTPNMVAGGEQAQVDCDEVFGQINAHLIDAGLHDIQASPPIRQALKESGLSDSAPLGVSSDGCLHLVPAPPSICQSLTPFLLAATGLHADYQYPDASDYPDYEDPIITDGSNLPETLTICGVHFAWDGCGYSALFCDTMLETAELVGNAVGNGLDASHIHSEEADGSVNEAGQSAHGPDDAPWEEHVCRTASTAGSGGQWSVLVPADAAGLQQAEEASGFADIGRISLDFPDSGEIEQEICYDPGAWTPVTPPTEAPPSPSEVSAEKDRCNAALAVYLVGGAMIAAAPMAGPAGPAVALAGFGIGLGGALAAADHCGNYSTLKADEGYMRCTGYAEVVWGGAGANRFASTIASLGPLSVTGASSGSGLKSERFPPNVNDQTLYDGPDYEKGEIACDARLDDHRRQAYARYLEWGETDSDPGELIGDSAVADLTATVEVDVVPITAATDPLWPVGNGVYVDTATNALWIGCQEAGCPTEVAVNVHSCGRQVISPGEEQVVYDFVGAPGCLSIQLYVNGGAILETEELPILRLDGRFGGAGGLIGGEGVDVN